MRKILIILFVNATFSLGFTQTPPDQTQKLATLGKVWGFLKYYHPKVAKGKYDWDAELVKKVTQIESAKTKEEINKIYLDWISSLGKVRKRNCDNNIPDSLKYNLDIGWLNDTTIFNKDLVAKLNFIKENRSKHHYYIRRFTASPTFNKEKPYKDSVFPGEAFRLLSLYRYWNIINYFYPYKYVIGQNWNNVLTEMIPQFQHAKDTIAYNIAMLELTTKINDSHAFFYTKYIAKYFG